MLFFLQDPQNKKVIICDEKLKKIFDGKDRVGFLEIAKLIGPHFLWMKWNLAGEKTINHWHMFWWAIKGADYNISKMLGFLRSFIQPSLVVKPLEDIYSRLCVSLLPICGYKYASSFFFFCLRTWTTLLWIGQLCSFTSFLSCVFSESVFYCGCFCGIKIHARHGLSC